MPGASAARKAAFAILQEVDRGQGHSDDLLRDDRSMALMPAADRHLTTALVLGVLRWQIELDRVVRGFMSKPNARLDPAVLVALRLGAFQLQHLDRIPVHAAVDESVELVKRSGVRSAAGLVNAVLRKVATAAATGSAEGNSASAVAAHPAWMTQRWTRLLGVNSVRAICAHDQGQPATAIRLSTPTVERELAGAGIVLSPGSLLSAARIVKSGDVTSTAPFLEGRARLQDEGSQLVAEVAAAGSTAKDILDSCAAPGGKTLVLAERNPSARIVACEPSLSRLEKLRDRLAGLGPRVECRHGDTAGLPFNSEFDVVLADVPCSGTGTLSRNPEIRHRLQPNDLARQAERQRRILASALHAVRSGGRVVYSTCSLEPEENEDVISAVLAEDRNAGATSILPILNAMQDRGVLIEGGDERLRGSITPEGFLRLLPGALGTDGFFIAVLEKRGIL